MQWGVASHLLQWQLFQKVCFPGGPRKSCSWQLILQRGIRWRVELLGSKEYKMNIQKIYMLLYRFKDHYPRPHKCAGSQSTGVDQPWERITDARVWCWSIYQNREYLTDRNFFDQIELKGLSGLDISFTICKQPFTSFLFASGIPVNFPMCFAWRRWENADLDVLVWGMLAWGRHFICPQIFKSPHLQHHPHQILEIAFHISTKK